MDYLFLSGVLALDLVNTEVVVRGKRYDLFVTPEDVAVWWQQARTHHPDAEQVRANTDIVIWSAQLLEQIKQVRAAIRTLCTNLVERQSLDLDALTTLNTILALGYPALEAASGQEMIAVYRTRDDDRRVVLLPIALSALHLFTQAEHHRLHQCKNERCILFFYDTTRSATRQWCSLECMNRALFATLSTYQGRTDFHSGTLILLLVFPLSMPTSCHIARLCGSTAYPAAIPLYGCTIYGHSGRANGHGTSTSEGASNDAITRTTDLSLLIRIG
jgi:predicted RNA-binding Zn ribbon-like protein